MKSDMFIDPKSDYAFKRFFGTVSNKELTIGFLNSLLNKDIKDIIFHNVEMQGNNTDSRKAVFDLFCEGSDGELFIVEIQKKRQKYFSDRVLYYASFVIQMQADIKREVPVGKGGGEKTVELSYQQSVCSLLFGLPARYALHRQISLGCRAHGP